MVPGYKKIKEISHGPLTSVILCKQESLDREVLLKILHPQHAADNEIVERFIREAKMYAKLKHDNIVNVIDLGQENGSYFIAMEFIEGYTLEEFTKNYFPIPVPVANYIITKVLTGLNYAHENGIIHRDIKPSNILIRNSGEVKITDFGLARPLNLSNITEQGNIIGTPAYLAPELARSQPATVSSDIFALGATFYELFTNEKIFGGGSVAETINKILNLKPDPLHKKREDVPEWLSFLIEEMIEKKTNRRPDNCSTILKRIKKNTSVISKQEFTSFLNNEDYFPVKEEEIITEPVKKSNKVIVYSLSAVLIIIIIISGMILLRTGIPQNGNEINKVENTTSMKIPDNLKTSEKNNDADQSVELTDTSTFKGKSIKNEPKILSSNSKIKTAVKNEKKLLSGKLFLDAVPWGEIYLNGSKIDTTPISKPIELKPGKYDLEIRNPSYITYRKSIEIESGSIDSINVTLQQAFGNLKLTVVPWGKIYINKEFIDVTPINDPIKLKTGQNELEIINPNFAIYTEIVNISAGETIEKTIYLSKQ